jgi:hypothetical protein
LSVTDPADDDAPCPACGGKVEDRGDTGVCTSCGLELKAVEDNDKTSSLTQAPGLAKALTASLARQLGAGVPLETAVERALLECGLDGTGDGPAPASQARFFQGSCPICLAAETPGAAACGRCGISFNADGPVSCPRCANAARAQDGECACGALLSLAAVRERFDDSVVRVCLKCKQLYSAPRQNCADCGGELVSADGLRAWIKTHPAPQEEL